VTHNTIQSIALLLSHKPSNDPALLADWDKSDAAHNFNPTSATRGKTLIVLPTIALRQWQAEIVRFTKPGSVSVYCYHGNTRSSDNILETICSVEVVLTSYKILESEYRRATAGSKIECSVCGKKFYPEKLRVHRKYFCGETSQRTSAQSKTMRKSQPKQKSGKASEGDSSSEEESGDEIDRQKKAIRTKISAKSQSEGQKKGKQTKSVAKDEEAPKKRAKVEKAKVEKAGNNRKEKETKKKPPKGNPAKGKKKSAADSDGEGSGDESDQDRPSKSPSRTPLSLPPFRFLMLLRVEKEVLQDSLVKEEKVDGRFV
jgi:hypothetical protein